jgi:hypothetical protein
MTMILRRLLIAAVLAAGFAAPASAQPFPNPIVRYVGQFPDAGLIHVDLTVTNWRSYAPALFVPDSKLSPCGLNANASRTSVDIYNTDNLFRPKLINSFCALGAPSELEKIWFATQPAAKPKFVYIIMRDRLRHLTRASHRFVIP